MVEVLKLAKEDQFRRFVLAECVAQRHGEYNVYIRDIVANYIEDRKYSATMKNLQSLSEQIKLLNGGTEPLIFYPRAETIEDQMTASKNARIADVVMNEPLGVFQVQDEGSSARVSSMPEGPQDAYRAYVNGSWIWVQQVDEEYAWETDIYVVGNEENVSSGNMVQTGLRINGEAEYGGQIQVTNLNAIEHWTMGKLEFKMIVIGASGNPQQNIPFGKYKRKNFRDNQWFDFNYFIGNWNGSVYGPYMSETWIEEDGGTSSSTTITVPPNTTYGTPGYAVNYPSKDRDDKLGTFIVQFTDAKSQVYNIQYANVKRK